MMLLNEKSMEIIHRAAAISSIPGAANNPTVALADRVKRNDYSEGKERTKAIQYPSPFIRVRQVAGLLGNIPRG